MHSGHDRIPTRPDRESPDSQTGFVSDPPRPSRGTAAVVLGIIGLIPVVGFLPAILATILGGISIERTLPGTRERKVAIVGLGLGVTMLVVDIILFALIDSSGGF